MLKKNYSHAKADVKKNRKRQEAEDRNKSWAKLSRDEQLKSLASRRGESKKQVERINQFNKNL